MKKLREFLPTIAFHVGFATALVALITGSTRCLAISVMCFSFTLADINDRGWEVQHKVMGDSGPKTEREAIQ